MITINQEEQFQHNDIAFRMTGILKRFGPVQALSGVSFAVRAGTVHALVGENGAGKSTLMKILSGVYKPDSGSIEIGNRRFIFNKPADALAAGAEPGGAGPYRPEPARGIVAGVVAVWGSAPAVLLARAGAFVSYLGGAGVFTGGACRFVDLPAKAAPVSADARGVGFRLPGTGRQRRAADDLARSAGRLSDDTVGPLPRGVVRAADRLHLARAARADAVSPGPGAGVSSLGATAMGAPGVLDPRRASDELPGAQRAARLSALAKLEGRVDTQA